MIEVRGLSKSYGDFQAVKDVSFRVERGEIVGFLGPNGAGKSTTMKILTGFMTQSGGSISVDGLDVNKDALKVRQKLGYLPEANPLYTDMIVYDYLAYVAAMRGVPSGKIHERIGAAVRMCGLVDRVGQVIGTLSKGYKQRVGLAQALIHDPDVLILDEPTSGLDPNQIVEIRNLVKELGKDRTIILSTHNLPEVTATCNRMLIIHQGQLVADGTPEELQAREQDNPLVRLVVRGVDGEAARAKVAALDGVDEVGLGVTGDPGAVALEVRAAKDADPRAALSGLAQAEGWELLELSRAVLDLEGLFRKLTRPL